MTLLAGAALNAARFFRHGSPTAQGSSFDLTIGQIYGQDGNPVNGPFVLKPGHMVQVVSEELFNLPAEITGHVTYKTGLTRKGIWALTVGIVDPGWNGPIGTTLLNFSRVDYTIHAGDPFLRVSFFEHQPAPQSALRPSPPLADYLKDIRSLASSRFPPTFLNSDQIVHDAGKAVMDRIRSEGIAWLGITAIVFALIQVLAPPAARWVDQKWSPTTEEQITVEVQALRSRVEELETVLREATSAVTAPGAPTAEQPAEPDAQIPSQDSDTSGE